MGYAYTRQGPVTDDYRFAVPVGAYRVSATVVNVNVPASFTITLRLYLSRALVHTVTIAAPNRIEPARLAVIDGSRILVAWSEAPSGNLTANHRLRAQVFTVTGGVLTGGSAVTIHASVWTDNKAAVVWNNGGRVSFFYNNVFGGGTTVFLSVAAIAGTALTVVGPVGVTVDSTAGVVLRGAVRVDQATCAVLLDPDPDFRVNPNVLRGYAGTTLVNTVSVPRFDPRSPQTGAQTIASFGMTEVRDGVAALVTAFGGSEWAVTELWVRAIVMSGGQVTVGAAHTVRSVPKSPNDATTLYLAEQGKVPVPGGQLGLFTSLDDNLSTNAAPLVGYIDVYAISAAGVVTVSSQETMPLGVPQEVVTIRFTGPVTGDYVVFDDASRTTLAEWRFDPGTNPARGTAGTLVRVEGAVSRPPLTVGAPVQLGPFTAGPTAVAGGRGVGQFIRSTAQAAPTRWRRRR